MRPRTRSRSRSSPASNTSRRVNGQRSCCATCSGSPRGSSRTCSTQAKHRSTAPCSAQDTRARLLGAGARNARPRRSRRDDRVKTRLASARTSPARRRRSARAIGATELGSASPLSVLPRAFVDRAPALRLGERRSGARGPPLPPVVRRDTAGDELRARNCLAKHSRRLDSDPWLLLGDCASERRASYPSPVTGIGC